MAVKITYFVHGTTTDNEKDLATGWSQGQLSKKGIKQAKELGTAVSGRKFDAVFCSDLKRAADSADLAFSGIAKIIKDKRLRECNYGDFTGRPAEEVRSRMKEQIDVPFPNGESYRDVEKRIAGFLEFLRRSYDNRHVAVVAHQAPQFALDVLIKRKTWEEAIEQDWRKSMNWQPGWEYTA